MNRGMALFFGMMIAYTVIAALAGGQAVNALLVALYAVSALISAYCGFGLQARRLV